MFRTSDNVGTSGRKSNYAEIERSRVIVYEKSHVVRGVPARANSWQDQRFVSANIERHANV